tara:strand:- start:234 stop:398 length:165 start_codon:yes stop_codon:yes gene_type:complete
MNKTKTWRGYFFAYRWEALRAYYFRKNNNNKLADYCEIMSNEYKEKLKEEDLDY